MRDWSKLEQEIRISTQEIAYVRTRLLRYVGFWEWMGEPEPGPPRYAGIGRLAGILKEQE